QSFYLDVLLLERYWGTEHVYHHTAPISLFYALREALAMLVDEGLEARHARHLFHHQALQAGLEHLGIGYIAAAKHQLPQLNCVSIPPGIDDKSVRQRLLREWGIEIGGALGPLQGKAWRIGLMGETARAENVKLLLGALETCLRDLGHPHDKGAAVDAADQVYHSSGHDCRQAQPDQARAWSPGWTAQPRVGHEAAGLRNSSANGSSSGSLDGAPEISVVVPLYNEQDVLAELYKRICVALEAAQFRFEIVFVNDGSRDATPCMLDGIQSTDPRVGVVHLSRNFGHQAAVSAGLDHARGQAVAVIDGDLQDPPELIPEMVAIWRQGNEVVYAVREKRKEGPLKRAGYLLFYRLLRLMSELEIPLDSGDFCLLDRKVVDVLRSLPERLRFIRGLRTYAGFRQVGFRYERPARAAGKPKYSLRGLVTLAVDGLVSFSSYPLHLVTYLGVFSAGLALLCTIWVLYDAFINKTAPRGWASTVVVVLYMSGIQLVSLGIIGEYVRRIFIEAKGRPTYIVRSFLQGKSASLPQYELPSAPAASGRQTQTAT
ncbi:MAG TPA: glycosyltransferase, partial [Isosphaeraceae bacterium]|nr:glycosyltransferase [Isosphaeraceae bacterium]